MTTKRSLIIFFLVAVSIHFACADDKPRLTLDEFFNWVFISELQISPDGTSVVMVVERPDWDKSIFRDNLWLYREDGHGGALTQLTQSGRDRHPQWSPDGRWIAFLSARRVEPQTASDDSSEGAEKDEAAQLYLISTSGGEAFPASRGEEVHDFAWSTDSRTLYFATRTPWSKAQNDAYHKEWENVVQYRAAERGDTIFRIDVADAIAARTAEGAKPPAESAQTQSPSAKSPPAESEDAPDLIPGTRVLAASPWRVQQLVASPDGRRLAFVGEPVSEREEKIEDYEIYSVDLANASPDRALRQLTHNQALEQDLCWARDSKHIFFQVQYGSVEGKYKDTQIRLYWADADSGEVQRWGSDFDGAIYEYSVRPEGGGVVAAGRIGTELQLYSQATPSSPFSKLAGWDGTYEKLSSAARSPRLAFVHSTLEKPTEVYLADGLDKLQSALPITAFNQFLTRFDLPKGEPYRWTADDGTPIEGMLLYPPGEFEAKNLPMFVLIHGGPDDADGNHFEADWYVWDRIAATQGWLVFEPNYRGSEGYGDKFMSAAVPQMLSRPGKDILEGIDALVKAGIANSDHLAVGGYSSGGYLTNWLITQTTRFKAAVTGGGAVENVAEWGNDDTTFDDAYYLSGTPWQARQHYEDEGAIFQIDKVRTPTHIVAGADDIRVSPAQAYLLDHALFNLGVPSQLLIFPGEDHSLSKNPWDGKIKVREELKWLQKYGGIGPKR